MRPSRRFYKVKEDVISNYNKGKVYAVSGSLVIMVANHDNVLICQHPNGDKFPVKTINVQRYFHQKGISQFINNNLKISFYGRHGGRDN